MPSDGNPFILPQTYVPSSLRAESKDYCQAWNQEHYRTFDGKLYSYPSQCTYIFAKDCAHQNFAIYTTNGKGCFTDQKCTTDIDIYVGADHAVTLTRINGRVTVRTSISCV